MLHCRRIGRGITAVTQTDKRREWASLTAAQIVNLHWSTDAPKHVTYSEIEKIILAALCMSASELRYDMLKPSEN
jgi:hypothetical protein